MPKIAGLIVLALALLAACTDAAPESAEQVAPLPAVEQADDRQAVDQQTADRSVSATEAAEQAQPESDDESETPVQPTEESKAESSDEPEEQPAAESSAPRLADVRIGFEEAIRDGPRFGRPTDAFSRHGGNIFVAEQEGAITMFNPADGSSKLILDLPVQVGFEEGLLSIRRGPHAEDPFYIYAWYTPPGGRLSRLSRFHFEDGFTFENGDVAELVILEVAQPYPNHNGGAIRFGPDGMLYLGIGDGGAAGDPLGSGQDRSTLLGSIIRIDVGEASAAEPYRIPPDNPFVGVPGARPEIWAYGLRNPWRMDFDSRTGDLWVADVGQNAQEEIAIVRRGENHGWNVYEGDLCFNRNPDCGALEAVAPIATYGRGDGCSVSGGVFYSRGNDNIPGLAGAFIYGDYCTGKIWAATADGEVVELADTDWPIVSFATDSEGGLLLLAQGQPIRRIIAATD